MTPEEALELVDRALASMQGTRQDHVTIAQAVQTIRDALKPEAADGNSV